MRILCLWSGFLSGNRHRRQHFEKGCGCWPFRSSRLRRCRLLSACCRWAWESLAPWREGATSIEITSPVFWRWVSRLQLMGAAASVQKVRSEGGLKWALLACVCLESCNAAVDRHSLFSLPHGLCGLSVFRPGDGPVSPRWPVLRTRSGVKLRAGLAFLILLPSSFSLPTH